MLTHFGRSSGQLINQSIGPSITIFGMPCSQVVMQPLRLPRMLTFSIYPRGEEKGQQKQERGT